MIAAIISKDPSLRNRLESALGASEDVDSVLIIPDFPGATDIRALEQTQQKYIAFIDFRDDPSRAIALASEINRFCPSVATVGVNVSSTQADMIVVVRAGICEVLPQPFSNLDVATAVLNVGRKLSGASATADGVVFAFLPAKPGSGASSLAAYTALACARLGDRRPLLVDFDMRLGITSFVLKLDSTNSIIDALENTHRMDQTLWDQLVSKRDNLDILGSAPGRFGDKVPVERFKSLLKWARQQYAAVVVDLPGTLEDFEIAALQQAGSIFLVCGPDLVGLHVARQTIQRLHSLDLLDRVSVLLNRVDKHTGLSIRDIQSILGVPIRVTLPADERGIRDAVQGGVGVKPKSSLGKQIEVIARQMIGKVQSLPRRAAVRPPKRFIQFFSVPQDKGADPWQQ